MCDQKLLVPIPDLLTIRDFDPTHPEFGINDAGERCLNLDACIVPAVQALWAAGIVTEACCCGHGEAWGVITVQRQEDPSLRGAVLLRREEYNDLTAAQATIAQRDAQVAALQVDRDAWRKEREDVANLLYSQEGRLGALTEQLAARDALVAELTAALQDSRIDHRTIEGDPWFDCPEGSRIARGYHLRCDRPCDCACDCGADTHNARIDELLARTPAAPKGE